jgi:hypothetical protein
MRIIVSRLTESHVFVIQGLHLSIVFVIWSVLSLVIWLILFAANPLPAHDDKGGVLKLDLSAASWITSLLFSLIFLSVLVLLKCFGLRVSIFSVS